MLADIRETFGTAEKMPSAELVDSLLGLEDGPYQELNHGRQINQNWLAKSLKGVVTGKSGTIRIGKKTPKGYQRTQFEEAWDRYLPKTPKNPATAATPPQGERSLPDVVTKDAHDKDQDEEIW